MLTHTRSDFGLIIHRELISAVNIKFRYFPLPWVWSGSYCEGTEVKGTTSILAHVASATLMNKSITLTPAQAAFLDDRPEECVAESVRDCFPGVDDDDVCQAVDNVSRLFGWDPRRGTYKPEVIELQRLSNIETTALLDFLEGSTVCGQLWDSMHMDRSQVLAYGRAKRTLHVIVDKFRAAGLNVTFIPDA